MRWLKSLERYASGTKGTLKAVNPRLGTSVIPLRTGDEGLFFNFLQDKVQSLYFEGDEKELKRLIQDMEHTQGVIIHKMNYSSGRSDRMLHLHLGLPNFREIRRVIRIQN